MEEGKITANAPEGAVALRLDPAQIELLRSALRYLESTLGREEADELRQVQELEALLDRAGSEGRG